MQIPYRKPGKFSQTKPDNLLTEAKVAEFKNKLAQLKSIQPGAASEVARLAEMGDFSENAEYQMAKGRLRGILHGILKLENQLNYAVIIAKPKQTDRIQIGHTVAVAVDGKKRTYQILGSSETNPQKGIISHSSPIGAALVGRKVGERVSVKIAGKDMEYTILTIF